MTIYANIAGISLAFTAREGLSFSEEALALRGFACGAMQTVDFSVEVSLCSALHSFSRSEGLLAEGDNVGHTWHILHTSHSDTITVIFQEPSPYVSAQMHIQGRNISFQLYTAEPTTTITAYLFPIFNLMLVRLLHQRGGLLVHSSVVSDEEKGYLFTAVSGTGKSTMARLWHSCGARIINDDMIALTTEGLSNIVAHNIPMPYYSATPAQVPLKGIFLISQSPNNYIRPVYGALANLRFLANTIYQPLSKGVAQRHLDIVSVIAERVPIYELGFKPDTDIVQQVRSLQL